jgi:large repetitive protein
MAQRLRTLPTQQFLAITSEAWDSLDCDGDGVINRTEVTDNTDPQVACSLNKEHITLKREKYCGPEIPEAFSPNGDGVNDTFVINGIEEYPANTLNIFNRWGNIVYKAKPYKSDWNGDSDGGIKIGNDNLPTGVYFYILDLGNGAKAIQGNVYLSR